MAALRSEGLALAQRLGQKGDAAAIFADGYVHGVKHALAHPEACREETPATRSAEHAQAGMNADAIWAMRRKKPTSDAGGEEAHADRSAAGGATSAADVFASRRARA